MNRTYTGLILGLVAYLGAITFGASAEKRLPPLSEGMTSGVVTQLWGPPPERIEQETKRGEVWHYGESSVQFIGGKVTSWKNATVPQVVAVAPTEKKGEESGDLPVADLLEDIIEDPAESTKGGTEPQSAPGEITPLQQ